MNHFSSSGIKIDFRKRPVTHLIVPVGLPEVPDELVRDIEAAGRDHRHLLLLFEEL